MAILDRAGFVGVNGYRVISNTVMPHVFGSSSMRSGIAGIHHITRTETLPRIWGIRPPRSCLSFKHVHSASLEWRPVQLLQDGSVETFRRHAFQAQQPILMPLGHFSKLPAVTKWFKLPGQQLNYSYLEPFSSAIVPLELSDASNDDETEVESHFQRSGRCLRFTHVPAFRNA